MIAIVYVSQDNTSFFLVSSQEIFLPYFPAANKEISHHFFLSPTISAPYILFHLFLQEITSPIRNSYSEKCFLTHTPRKCSV